MNIIQIHKLYVHDLSGKTHCWTPIVNGKPLEYKGTPPFSVKAAKKAAAKELKMPVKEITFNINR